MLLATRPPSMQVNAIKGIIPINLTSWTFVSWHFFRQVRPHQAQPCPGLQRWWHDHPWHRQWLQGKLFCALANVSSSHLRWLYSLRRAIRHKLCWDQQLWAELWLAYYHQHSNWVSRNIYTKHWMWLSYHDHLSGAWHVAAKTWAQLCQQRLPVFCHKSTIKYISKAHMYSHSHLSPHLLNYKQLILEISFLIIFSNLELESTWRTPPPLRPASPSLPAALLETGTLLGDLWHLIFLKWFG